MPELPEVETTVRGVAPQLINGQIERVIVRQPSLRWPVTPELAKIVEGQNVCSVHRRAKYIIMQLDHGSMLVHLGMSGSLRLVNAESEWRKHDHIAVSYTHLRAHET